MWCIVNLPNGTQQAVRCDPKAIGQECLEKVCKALNIICEMEYFGLEHWSPNEKEPRTRHWINLRNRLNQDSSGSSSIQLMLALRVKFWVPVHLILQESVRNIFYMQAKVDLIEGRLNAKDWNNAAKLGALLCQADGVRFNETSLTAKCPIKIRRELQQQQLKEKKDKEPTLAFKKRRLSKQKSMESFDLPALPSPTDCPPTAVPSSNTSTNPLNLTSSSSSSLPSTASNICSSNNNNNNSNNNNNNNNSNNNSSNNGGVTINSIGSSLPCSNGDSVGCNITTTIYAITETSSPLSVYEEYIIRPVDCADLSEMPENFLQQIALEHSKLTKLKMSSKSAKYWLLKEIQELPGFSEEVFTGVTANENSVRCDISVGAHGLTVYTSDEKYSIPFSAIAAAKSFRRTFKLEYVDDHSEKKELEVKLPKHSIAADLYRSITERHAFYVCDKVRVVVTSQFTRDLKGTIASMFKEDTELGKKYVFDIQRTCREVHDQARRILYERGIEVTSTSEDVEKYLPSVEIVDGKSVDDAIKAKADREAAIEKYIDSRISEAMTCKICMDNEINAMFNPCGHVTACIECAGKCDRCPNCRVKVTSVVKIFLPTELRTSGSGRASPANSQNIPPKKSTEISLPSSSLNCSQINREFSSNKACSYSYGNNNTKLATRT